MASGDWFTRLALQSSTPAPCNEVAKLELFRELETPPWRVADVEYFWTELRRLTALRGDELLDTLDDLTSNLNLPTWLVLFVFELVWNAVLHSTPPMPSNLRALRLTFESIEQRPIEEGLAHSVDVVRSLCVYLPEIIEDDLNWTGFELPGENTPR